MNLDTAGGDMGKWAEVECNCANRVPVPNSDTEPYYKKRRLTAIQKQEREIWECTTRDMYACGHQSGVIIEFWPGDIIRLGYHIARILDTDIYPVFTKVGDRHSYVDELLLISPYEAIQWLEEIKTLQHALLDATHTPVGKIQDLIFAYFYDHLAITHDIEEHHEKWNTLRRQFEISQHPMKDSTLKQIGETLDAAAALCDASMMVENPIRLLL